MHESLQSKRAVKPSGSAPSWGKGVGQGQHDVAGGAQEAEAVSAVQCTCSSNLHPFFKVQYRQQTGPICNPHSHWLLSGAQGTVVPAIPALPAPSPNHKKRFQYITFSCLYTHSDRIPSQQLVVSGDGQHESPGLLPVSLQRQGVQQMQEANIHAQGAAGTALRRALRRPLWWP